MFMFLKQFETVGFKSFAERTTIEFVPGVTAIVGPNGSGKSNIIDAMRWVLGEQSAKSLRGQKMEDIIFQGSDSRKQLNFAEVSLILNNEDKVMPIDFQEVSVTRRVYRSGESEFYINKQACRLKDIVDLFIDTGLGRESFSIIGQGKIDEILSSKAEDRRAVFEEAAGVLKYKQRKNKAEYKLQETANNLDRVEDIIHEIEQQIVPLKKQAEIAKQYKVKRKELEQVEIALLVTEIEQLHVKWKTLLSDIERDKLQEIKEKTTIQEKEATITKERHLTDELDKEITELQQQLLRLTEQIEQIEGKRNVLTERLKHMEENKQKLKHDSSQLEQKIKQTKQAIDQENEHLREVSIAIEQINKEINSNNNKLFHELKDIKEEIEDLKSDYIEYLNEQAVLQNEQQTVSRQLVQIDQKKREQKSLYKKHIDEEESLVLSKQHLVKEISKKVELIKTKESTLLQLKENISKLRDQYEEMRQKLYEGNEKIATVASKKEMLIEMKDSFQGYFYGVKEVLQAAKEERLQGIEGAVVDLINVPTKYMTAIDTILGAQSQYIVVPNDLVARNVIQWLKKENKGRATFLPLESIVSRKIPQQIVHSVEQYEGFLGVADQLVQVDEKYKKVVEHLMGNVLIANNLTTANDIAKVTNKKYRIVTLEGDVVYPGGSMSGGAVKKKNQSLFTREKEIISLEEKLQKYEDRRNQFIKKVNSEKERISQLENIIDKEATEIEQMKHDLQRIRSEDNEITIKLKTAKNNLATYYMTMNEFQADEQHFNKTHQEIVEKLATMQTKIAQTEQKIEHLTNEEKNVQLSEKNVEKKLQQLQINVAEREERKKNHIDRRAGLQTQLDEFESEYDNVLKQLEEIIEVEQSARTEELAEQLITQKSLRNETNILIEEKRKKRKEKQRFIEDEENELKGLNKVYAQFVKEIQEKEVQANRLDVSLENRLQFLQSEYVITYEKASQNYEQVDNLEEAKITVQQLKQSIEKLGVVNLGAIDEYDRLQERYTFLTKQQNDLIEAKQTLYTVISEMDNEMTTRFSTVFHQIQNAFTDVFKKLFGGGHAELFLTDSSNLLETGIEIVARPPGKKMKTLELLSGGERALTAIALLFAILRARPVPFCILDEVDAALDEANVMRFGNYLKTFSEDTQFIVITHRQRTMEEADVLYGVTMQESGVSRLVSVRLEETKDLVEVT